MASQAKRMWLHDEDDTIKILPVTTVDNIKIQPDRNEDEFLSFEEDYQDVKQTIANNKSSADRSLNSLDNRVTILENAGGGGGGSASIGLATAEQDGLMSMEDKAKLDDIADNANRYILPKATVNILGGVKPDGTTITVESDGTIHSLGGSGGATVLEALANVEIRALLDGDILMYNHSKKKWINTLPDQLGGGGGSANIEYISFDDIISLFNTEDTTYLYDLNRAY